MLLESLRDRRVLDWLVEQVGPEAVSVACSRLAGRRRPYPSNIAKALGITPPTELAVTPREDAKRHLSACKALLKGVK